MDNFQRDITFKFSRTKDNDIVVTNTLQDRFHDILLEVIVDNETLVIKDARVNFLKSPNGNCPKVQEKLNLLTGWIIGKGMSKKLAEVLGGSSGCINLRNILLSSLPIVLNVKAAEGIKGDKEMLDGIHEKLIGTCIGYSEPPL